MTNGGKLCVKVGKGSLNLPTSYSCIVNVDDIAFTAATAADLHLYSKIFC